PLPVLDSPYRLDRSEPEYARLRVAAHRALQTDDVPTQCLGSHLHRRTEVRLRRFQLLASLSPGLNRIEVRRSRSRQGVDERKCGFLWGHAVAGRRSSHAPREAFDAPI